MIHRTFLYNGIPVQLEIMDKSTKIYVNNTSRVVNTTIMGEIYKKLDLILSVRPQQYDY